ncbi:sigma-70 family RNA polymerase sigma factor [Streptomyces phaeochromogenes]|uniref:sigma-70 family RNA polymerase sigma factor n=1 Tax=Streptomyces phaeochromogenes TaxID=1923 RepID=UPI0022503A54|nr:sigma-70 family RNA polymerase sigma factor [Streptomyces phaeochromogenes]MCX5598395.1 sigma-70 family RNA polymerase sigma factor [Streptomyces phaeochromogenes]
MTTPPSPFENLKHLAEQGDPIQRAKDVGAALQAIPELQHWLREIRQGAVQEMREDGKSHADVGAELGLSRARAQQIAEGRTTGKRAKAGDEPQANAT